MSNKNDKIVIEHFLRNHIHLNEFEVLCDKLFGKDVLNNNDIDNIEKLEHMKKVVNNKKIKKIFDVLVSGYGAQIEEEIAEMDAEDNEELKEELSEELRYEGKYILPTYDYNFDKLVKYFNGLSLNKIETDLVEEWIHFWDGVLSWVIGSVFESWEIYFEHDDNLLVLSDCFNSFEEFIKFWHTEIITPNY